MKHQISPISRRSVLAGTAAGAAVALFGKGAIAAQSGTIVKAYRNPGCGCCEKWAGLMQEAGFAITMEDDANLADRKTSLGIPDNLSGCHTAMIGDYVIEGHVPPDDIILFLAERPAALGLAVPGMPAESPGMEVGGAKEAFDVMLLARDGSSKVYAHHG